MIPSQAEIDDAQQRLVGLVRGEWAAMDQDPPNVRQANRNSKAANVLVAGWAEHGGNEMVQAILLPLLTDPSPQVRCAAAARLLRRGAADQAVPVLEAIADDEELGNVGTQADGVLLVWEDESATSG